MRNLKGKVAAVTGAGSGIGRGLALALAAEGCGLSLSDVDDEGLAETGRLLDAQGTQAHLAHVDVADRQAVFDWADQVVAEQGAAHLVFNNAGVALGAGVVEMKLEELEWLMSINFWGVVYGTKAFLPHFERAGEGHVVNISSVFGLIAFPGNGAYNAAKFAVRGYTEALSIELRAARSPILASSVHPGGVATGIARNARVGEALAGNPELGDAAERDEQFQKAARTSAEDAARQIVRGVKKDKPRILVGSGARTISAMQRLFPTLYQRMLARAARGRAPGLV